ncbi:auxin-responsive protein saur32 [Nicotiana attenuata]|uniref:Auxin-responsive protein saur32 n=1 Tax=Nicotiana attenuata TaxID=49451 RepID=A0A1J6L0G0_NICAT|nr:auxin-responsive protein saur32 [Nicotiana attenuata]
MGNVDERHHHSRFHVQLHLPFHFHHHGHEKEEIKDIPRGCVAVMVGQGEEQQKFVIPVMHINHPLFIQLLKGAEEEYEFHHNGPINIPCHVEEFRYVEDIIDKDHHLWTCFKA